MMEWPELPDNPQLLEAVLRRFHKDFPAVIDCGKGWHQLIIDCDLELAAIDPNYRIYQIKEKFGTLRYYFQQSDEMTSEKSSYSPIRLQMNKIVSTYESVSSYKCEHCGVMGARLRTETIRNRTLCDKCQDKLTSSLD